MPQQELYKRDYIFMRYKDGPAEKVAVADMVQKLHAGYCQCKPPEGVEVEEAK